MKEKILMSEMKRGRKEVGRNDRKMVFEEFPFDIYSSG